MTIRKVSYLQGTVAVPYKLPAEDHRLNHAGLWVPSSALGGLRVRSGFVPGPGSPATAAVVAGGVNVNPFHAVIQGTLTSTQGVYEFASDAVEFRAITAASPTEFRRGYIVARVYDQLNPGTGTVQDLPTLEVVYGPNAATAGAAQLPPLPDNAIVVRGGEFAVSNTGVITLVAGSGAPWVVTRGGIQPVDTADVVAPAYDGQYRDHPTRGLERGKGGAWTPSTLIDAPMLKLRRAVGHNITSSIWTPITWDTEDWDTHDMYPYAGAMPAGPASYGPVNSANVAQIKRSGYYDVTKTMHLITPAGSYRMMTTLYVNGVERRGASGLSQHGGGETGMSDTHTVQLNNGDLIYMTGWHDGGGIAVTSDTIYATTTMELSWRRPL